MQFLFYREYKVCYFVYLNILNFDVLLIYSQVKIERESIMKILDFMEILFFGEIQWLVIKGVY